MRPPRQLVRRVLIDPVWVPLAVLLAAVSALAAVIGIVVAPIGPRRLPRLAAAASLYLLVNASLVVCCAVLWLRYPVPGWRGTAWADAHQQLLRRTVRLMVRASAPLLGFRVQLEAPPDQAGLAGHPLLVLARHGGPGDSVAIADLLLSRYRRRPVIVMKESLRWDPGLDVLLSRMPSCFLPSRSAGRDLPAHIAAVAAAVDRNDAMLIFPEGGNWTPSRYRRALVRLRARGRRVAAARAAANPHVLPPQPAGVLACLAARPDLDVVVVAHTGLDDLVSPALVWRALPLTDRPMVMRWWHLPAAVLPAATDLRQDWVDVQWAIVDSWIDARKAARSRRAGPDSPDGMDIAGPQRAADAAAGPG